MSLLLVFLSSLLFSSGVLGSAACPGGLDQTVTRMTRAVVEYELTGRRLLDLSTLEDAIAENGAMAAKDAETLGSVDKALAASQFNLMYAQYLEAKQDWDSFKQWLNRFVIDERSFLKTRCGSEGTQAHLVHLFSQALAKEYSLFNS